MPLDVRRLSADDVDDARRLSTQAGWNQTTADWRRLLELFPETCFAGYADGELVATSTLATYGDTVGCSYLPVIDDPCGRSPIRDSNRPYETVAWIGMVLVDETHRRRGYGSDIFERALEAGLDREIDSIGLDATDAGATVYRQYDFVTVGGIDRWRGTLDGSAVSPDRESVRPIRSATPLFERDAAVIGADRRPLLENLLASHDTTGFLVERDDVLDGYAIVRPGRTCPQVGPIVARNTADAVALLSAIATTVDEPVVVDALRDDHTTNVLDRFGLDVQRRLHRMTYDQPTQVLNGNAVVAAAGFEWG